jgi:hypothetical protein
MSKAVGLLVVGLMLTAGATYCRADDNKLTAAEIAEGWIQLFDGETLFGWKAATKADWKVADGAILVTTGDVGLLNTTSQFGDFILKADFRASRGTNSGIFLRTKPEPLNPKDGCYELNIAPFGSTPFATGSLVARKKVEENLDSEDWQSYEVTCLGPRIGVKLNGREVLDFTDREPVLRGHIGLQLNKGQIEFRNVKLKPLSLPPIFNGRDLTGWHTHPKLKNAFSVDAEGQLQLKGGKSQLETEMKYGDFVLQLVARSNRERSNSGLFFRSIPGEEMNGYECQLQHCYGKDGKPNPVDCGTGGICRRQIARKLAAKDGEWFYLTLAVHGPHMAAWVNGYAVSDFTDERRPHANPRQGKRVEAGTFILQGHDDTTDFTFGKIAAGELPRSPEGKIAN